VLFILEDADARIARFRKVLGEIPHHIERTVPEAKQWLEEHGDTVALYSLDNDLYLPDFDEILARDGSFASGCSSAASRRRSSRTRAMGAPRR